MADTKITRLRNLLTPVKNYFTLLEVAEKASANDEIEKFNVMLAIMRKEIERINETKEEIWGIIAEIPDNACEGSTETSDKASLLTDVSCRFSDADVRNIVLEMQNAAMQAHSHNLSRFETRVELQKVKKRWNL